VVKIRIQQYTVWFIVNFLLCCLTPILFAYVANRGTNQIFSGYLSYSFTLLISCYYLYQVTIYMKDKKNWPTALLWLTLCWVITLFALFSFFPEIPQAEIKMFIKNYSVLFSSVIFLITLTLALLLSRQSVEDLVAKIYVDRLKEDDNKLKKSISSMKAELEKDSKHE